MVILKTQKKPKLTSCQFCKHVCLWCIAYGMGRIHTARTGQASPSPTPLCKGQCLLRMCNLIYKKTLSKCLVSKVPLFFLTFNQLGKPRHVVDAPTPFLSHQQSKSCTCPCRAALELCRHCRCPGLVQAGPLNVWVEIITHTEFVVEYKLKFRKAEWMVSQGSQEVQWEEGYQGYCVSSHVICMEHHNTETMIKPLCSAAVLVGHPSHGLGAWVPRPKWAKQHLLSLNNAWGSCAREGSNGNREHPQ